jgi:hypothetical protein
MFSVKRILLYEVEREGEEQGDAAESHRPKSMSTAADTGQARVTKLRPRRRLS